ncbi:zf-HC2 domain-containing protein [Thiolapillus sp.]
MTDTQTSAPEELEKLHMKLQDMLAGYADEELEEQDTALVEAHLAGCESCRKDVARQQILHKQLGIMPVPHLSVQQQARFDKALQETSPVPGNRRTLLPAWKHLLKLRWPKSGNTILWATTAGWSLVVLLLVITVFSGMKHGTNGNIPMVQDVVSEYHQLARTNLPQGNPVQETTPPLSWPNAKVLAAWKTRVGGAPATAFAVRNGNKILLQFEVEDRVFFNNPVVRNAVADKGRYETQENNVQVLALPLRRGGILLVGPAGSLPPATSVSMKRF